MKLKSLVDHASLPRREFRDHVVDRCLMGGQVGHGPPQSLWIDFNGSLLWMGKKITCFLTNLLTAIEHFLLL